ncbi:TonB-dependent receptor [Rheinheimera sp. WS51]|uniref:TonB-dependent receptor n=1 Tax=Rheinheimera sp. WS51 TaxID=3425886 RepID=UPI003D8AFAF0
MKVKHLALAVTLALGVPSLAMADDVSSSIRGNIVTSAGQVAPNARIEILHVPTGTRNVAVSNNSGSFSSTGLRVGGPYTITITSDKGAKTYNNVFLSLGEALRLNAELEPVEQVERISVTGSSLVLSNNTGSSSYFGAGAIENAPTFNRDLKEVARMNPYANMLPGDGAPLSIGGVNPKFNSVSIDGVGVNDDFGLNSNGYPTQSSPVSIDAIDQIAVDVAPFDASEGGYSGGRINAVTKSGTNELHGSLTYERMSDSWAGTPKNPNTGRDVELDYERDTYSLTLGGPIVKDELFFFLAYEKSTQPSSVEYGPAGAGAPTDSLVTQAEYDRIKQIASQVYGIDAGEWNSSPDTEDKNLLVKLDWNINDEHRAAFTYNLTEGNNVRNQSSDAYTLQLDTNWYNYQQDMSLYKFSLFSDWSLDLSSELYFSYKEIDTISGLKTKQFGDISVRIPNGSEGTVNFGPDYNRHANELSNQDMKIGAKFTYLTGDHQIKFGGEYNKLDIFNIFVRNSLGSWNFSSIEDFENRIASSLEYENAYTNNVRDAGAEFSLSTMNAYIQDNWYVSNDVEVGLGLRYERYIVSDKPTLNENFLRRYGYSNQENLDGLDIVLPRVDVKWLATDDLTVRGGFGRFSGGKPNVWISNSFSNDGYTLVQFDRNSVAASDYLENVDITSVPDAVKNSLVAGDGDTNSIDPNFKMPSDWIARIGVDYLIDIPVLGDNFGWSAEVMRKWMTDNSQWKDISRCVSGQTAAGVNIYRPCDPTAPRDHYDIMLTNESKNGKAWIWNTSLAKNWDNGISFYASYTNQNIEEGTPGTSSTASSNYKYNIVKDRNIEEIGTADYEVEHSLKITLGYTHEIFEGYDSKFNLFFQRRSGNHFSYVMGLYRDGDFGDQDGSARLNRSSGYLAYIPTGPNDPNYSPESTIAFEDLMANIKAAGLEGYAGGFAPKGSGTSPWITTLDFQFQQDLPGFYEGHKGTFYFTVNNLLNLIDSSKGQVRREQFSNKTLVDFGGLDSEGRYIYEAPFGGFDGNTGSRFEAEESTWRLKMGLKYRF